MKCPPASLDHLIHMHRTLMTGDIDAATTILSSEHDAAGLDDAARLLRHAAEEATRLATLLRSLSTGVSYGSGRAQ